MSCIMRRWWYNSQPCGGSLLLDNTSAVEKCGIPTLPSPLHGWVCCGGWIGITEGLEGSYPMGWVRVSTNAQIGWSCRIAWTWSRNKADIPRNRLRSEGKARIAPAAAGWGALRMINLKASCWKASRDAILGSSRWGTWGHSWSP